MIGELQPTRRIGKSVVAGTTVAGVARVLAVAGTVLGVAAGVAQLLAGDLIPAWSGNKADTAGLGLATIVLSAVAGVCLWQSRRPLPRWGRLVAGGAGVAAVVVCFTTVGRLWYVPGPVLLVALLLAQVPELEQQTSAPASDAGQAARGGAASSRRALGWALFVVGAVVGLVVGIVPLVTVLLGRGPSSVGVAAAVVFALGLVVSVGVAPSLRRRLLRMPAAGAGAGLMGSGLALTCCAVMIALS
jgi:hypothetical protein